MTSDDVGAARETDARAAELARLCALRPLPAPVIDEIDTALVGYLKIAVASVRAETARRLATCDWAPLEAVRMLAFDRVEIARPLLERSIRLSGPDLEALADMEPERRCALARRPVVGERLSSIIARRREPSCLLILAENPGAALGEASAADFAGAARGAPDLQRALAERENLAPGLARALLTVAGEAVKATLAERWPDLAPGQAETAVDAAVDAAAVSPGAEDGAAAEMVERLARQRLLSARDLVRAAEGGRSAMTDHVAARLTGLDVEDWRRALARSPLRAILLTARASALPAEDAAAIHAALADAGRVHPLAPDRLAAACDDIYAAHARDAARRSLHRLGAGGTIR